LQKLKKQLASWQDEGLISADQTQQILAFEAARPTKHWALNGIIGVAIVAIGIGAVSIIAANWGSIPANVKLGVAFFLQFALGLVAWQFDRSEKKQIAEFLLIGFLFGCLGLIGLIGQVFHIAGILDEALLFWGAITAPIILLSNSRLTSSLWTWTLVIAAISWIMRTYDKDLTFLILTCLPFVCYLISVATKFVLKKDNLEWSWRMTMIATWFAAVVAFDARYSLSISDLTIDDPLLNLLPFALLAASLAIAWATKERKGSQFLLLAVMLVIFTLTGTLDGSSYGATFLGGIISIALLGMVCFDLERAKRRSLFQFLLVLIGIRILVFYFQALGGLALTGIGLIGFGGLLLFTIWAINKIRLAIQSKKGEAEV